MKTHAVVKFGMVCVIASAVLFTGCPAGGNLHVLWLVNSSDTSFTDFIYQYDVLNDIAYTVPLAKTLGPGQVLRFTYDDEFLADITDVGVKGPAGSLSMIASGDFGIGEDDFFVVNGRFPSFTTALLKEIT